MKNFFLLFVFLFTVTLLKGQNIISGTVLDTLTQKPVPFVSVFFANTTFGAVTDTLGRFEFKGFPNGKYDLTVSFVGYETYQQSLDFSNVSREIKVLLKQKVVALHEVQVKADTNGWYRNFREFKRYFLGQTKNSEQCVIQNPRDIHLYYDVKDRVLVAHAKKPLEIVNRAMGYSIIYSLEFFELDNKRGTMFYFGIPRFVELEPKSKTQQRRWEKERARAYYGSFGHFVKSLRQNKTAENSFRVHRFYRIPNPERPSEEFLQQKIKYHREKLMQEKGVIVIGKNDSLSFYYNLRSKPALIDSIGGEIKDFASLLDTTDGTRLNYRGMLQVVYDDEREEKFYAEMQGRVPAGFQYSIVNLLGKSLKLYENGYYEDVRDVFMEHYWGWSEKLADLLPLDYVPSETD